MPESPAPRRYDPGRREHIIAACLDVIAASGVAGTSHRKVAAAADVPLGSMTYHFTGMDELLREAFERFAREGSDRFEACLAGAGTREEAKAAVAAMICGAESDDRRNLVLAHELYTLAAREPAFRAITNAWMARSRAVLERHFDPLTARLLDALVEGMSIHRTLDTERQDAAIVTEAVERITG
ncbi:TetR family transcriptional regulator [Glycomyces endophyticus]|uniref:TetR family transcriptional regulator n=1 Tax=Glycomyces endophyticus TaxID=480996 RepID=A0ABP4SHK9_9ACTN